MWPGGEEHRAARAGGSEVGAPSVLGRRVSGVRSRLVLPDRELGHRRDGWVPAPHPQALSALPLTRLTRLLLTFV